MEIWVSLKLFWFWFWFWFWSPCAEFLSSVTWWLRPAHVTVCVKHWTSVSFWKTTWWIFTTNSSQTHRVLTLQLRHRYIYLLELEYFCDLSCKDRDWTWKLRFVEFQEETASVLLSQEFHFVSISFEWDPGMKTKEPTGFILYFNFQLLHTLHFYCIIHI